MGSNIKIIGENDVKNIQPHFKLVLPWHLKTKLSKEIKIC